MKSLAQMFVFILGWMGIMAIIAVICWLVGKWGKKHPEQVKEEPQPEEAEQQ